MRAKKESQTAIHLQQSIDFAQPWGLALKERRISKRTSRLEFPTPVSFVQPTNLCRNLNSGLGKLKRSPTTTPIPVSNRSVCAFSGLLDVLLCSQLLAIVLTQQSLHLSAPTSNATFTHNLSLLSAKSDSQRRDSLAYLTTTISSRPVNSPLPQPVSVILPLSLIHI